jgi:DNA (cytosine-5)-methyltransferase 1
VHQTPLSLIKDMNNDQIEELIDISKVSSNGFKFKTVSLFSGCGGLDLGFIGNFKVFKNKHLKEFSSNSFEVVWANEIDGNAAETYKNNIGKHIVCDDIKNIKVEDIPECDVVLGGFPCQDFSIAGKRKGFESERGNLYKEMIRVIKLKEPKAFVAENVKNIINPKLIDIDRNQPVIKTIIEDFSELGYDVKYKCLYAPDYGIPQRRERVIIVGTRKDLNLDFKYPISMDGSMTSKEAIDDLWGKELDDKIYNHNQISLAKFRPPSKVGTQGNQMIPADGPSHVMRAEHHMNIQGHYRTHHPEGDISNRNYWRRLTVREAARLQTFPDKFKFHGNKSSTYKQVGNAVPPILGWYIAKALEVVLKKTRSQSKKNETHINEELKTEKIPD